MVHAFGAEFRRVENREYLGKPALVAVAVRAYDTTVTDLWEAITTPERLVRWFLPVEGDLKPGGRYQLKGNAGGIISRCDPPEALDLTWEYGGGTGWVTVRLETDGRGGAPDPRAHGRTRTTSVRNTCAKYSPGAVGIG